MSFYLVPQEIFKLIEETFVLNSLKFQNVMDFWVIFQKLGSLELKACIQVFKCV